MTDDRKITVGLAPRTRPERAATSLIASERKTSEPATETAAPAPAAREPRQSSTTRKRAKTSTASRQAPQGKVQIAADVPAETRGRARAAYRFAQFHDRVPTWSEFVTNALEAEIRRIEERYNGGEPLEPIDENLPAGRPPTA